MQPLLKINDLDVDFIMGKKQVRILNQISFELFENEVLAMIGETGCGKSVMGNAVLRLLPKNTVIKGKMNYKDKDLMTMTEEEFRFLRGKEIASIPQSPSTSLNPLMKVGDQVAECATKGRFLKKEEKNSIKEKVNELFSKLQLPRRETYYPCELSGGMCQRVLISMGMIMHPRLLIVDEPTKAVDWILRAEIMKQFGWLKKEMKCAMLFITHDIGAAKQIADKIAVMYCGEIVEIGPSKEILENPQHPYTKGLIDSMPSRGFHAMKGFMPSFQELPNGCRFHNRCHFSEIQCQHEKPASVSISEQHFVWCHKYREEKTGAIFSCC